MNVFSKRPLCVILAVFMLMVALLLYVPFRIKLVLSLLLIAALIVMLARFRKQTIVIGILIALVFASLLSILYFDLYVGKVKSYIGTNGTFEVEIVDVYYAKEYATYADVVIRNIGEKKVKYPAKLECSYMIAGERGDIYSLSGVIGEIENNGTFDLRRYYNSKGCYLNIVSENGKASYIGEAGFSIKGLFLSINSYCEKRFATILDGDSFGLISALFLGNRDNVDPSIERDFSQIGITHMLAVSGTHLTILIGGLYGILRYFGIHKRIVVCVSISVCLMYIGLTGAAPCVWRSGIMFIIMSVSSLVFRENDPFTSLFTASALIIIFSPNSIYDAGLLLSIFSTFGILVVQPYLSSFVNNAKKKGFVISSLAALVSGIVITLAASLFTLPLNAVFFGRIYGLIVLSNLFFSFLFTVLLWLAPFAVILSYVPLIKNIVAWLCELVCTVIIRGTSAMASLDVGSVSLYYPFSSVLIILLVVAVVLMILWGIKNPFWCFVPLASFCLIYAVCSFTFLSHFNSYEYIACMNWQRNDMIAVHSDGNTAIIDVSHGGRSSSENAMSIVKERFFDERIEAYVLTHYHSFHAGTIDKITKSYYINTVYLPLPNNDDERHFAEMIELICNKNGVGFKYYDKKGIDLSDSVNICATYDSIKRSAHETIRLDVDLNGHIFSYFGAGVLETNSSKRPANTVFFGSHGPVVKAVSLANSYSVALFSNDDVNDLYNIDCEFEYTLSDSDGFEVVRIPKKK